MMTSAPGLPQPPFTVTLHVAGEVVGCWEIADPARALVFARKLRSGRVLGDVTVYVTDRTGHEIEEAP